MISQSDLIQIHYEFAMSIGTSLDLRKTLGNSLTVFLKKMNCPAGGVHFFKKDEDAYRLEKVISIPRHTDHIKTYQKALEHFTTRIAGEPYQPDDIKNLLPLSGSAEDLFFTIVELPDLGVVLLLTKEALDSLFVKSLAPIFAKLAVACKACLQNEELARHKNNLQELMSEQTSELVNKNQQLTLEIEHRIRHERALRTNEEKYRELVQNANSIILRWNKEGRVTFFNEYAQSVFGFSEEEIIGRHVVGTIVPETETTGRDLGPLMDDICRNPQAYEYNVNENIRKDGSKLWVAWTNKVLTDDLGRPVGALSIGADISDHKKAEQELQRAHDDLQYAKNAAEAASRAKSSFLANMSHELRTPLNAILGFSQIMAHSRNLNSEEKEYIRIINRSGEHLLALINAVLDMSRIESGQVDLNETDFDLYNFLNEMKNLFQMQAEKKGLDIFVEWDPELPRYVRADETKLHQIFANLLSNAVKFTKRGTIVVSAMSTYENADSTIGPGEQSPPSGVLHFGVADTGPGILQDELERLFDPFIRAKAAQNEHEGTGLGLAISRKFVQIMGGDITVESTAEADGHPGSSVFKFYVPVKIITSSHINIKQSIARVVALQPNENACLPHYRILLVDDVLSNRQVLKSLLAPLGFGIREAKNGQEALAVCETWNPHLIWLDMQIPEMDGYEVIKRIKKSGRKNPPVIISISASAFEEDRQKALDTGADGFVGKPFKESEIFEVMRKHLHLEYVYDEHIQKDDLSPENQEQKLSVESVKGQTSEWKTEMKRAIEHVDPDRMGILIAEIRKRDETLAEAIQQRIDQFEYEKVLEWL